VLRRHAAPLSEARSVHRQLHESDESIDYASMGQNPDAADNRWLREAIEHQVPIIYFLGIAPGWRLTGRAGNNENAGPSARHFV
jgi:hypothetical protein